MQVTSTLVEQADSEMRRPVTRDGQDGNLEMWDDSEMQDKEGLEVLRHTNMAQDTTDTLLNESGTT